MPSAADIEAEIRFLATVEGGKRVTCCNGYTTLHDFGLESGLTDARHVFPGRQEVSPGESVRSEMTFLAPELQRGRLYEGFAFTVQEGRQVVGQGRITRVLNAALLQR